MDSPKLLAQPLCPSLPSKISLYSPKPPRSPRTAEGGRAPWPHGSALALARSNIGANGLAHGVLVPLVQAGVKEAVIQVRGGVNDVVAGGKGPPFLPQQPTVLVPTVGTFLGVAAHLAALAAPR